MTTVLCTDGTVCCEGEGTLAQVLSANRADLRRAVLRGADLRDADLRGADLRGADLFCADMRGAVLIGAKLAGANLRGADVTGATLPADAPLTAAQWRSTKNGPELLGLAKLQAERDDLRAEVTRLRSGLADAAAMLPGPLTDDERLDIVMAINTLCNWSSVLCCVDDDCVKRMQITSSGAVVTDLEIVRCLRMGLRLDGTILAARKVD